MFCGSCLLIIDCSLRTFFLKSWLKMSSLVSLTVTLVYLVDFIVTYNFRLMLRIFNFFCEGIWLCLCT